MDNQKFGALIKAARIKKGYTQKDVANILGVTDKAVSKWECGKSFPDITLIASISSMLNISVNELVGIADNIKEDAIMIEKINKKIKIRLTISIVVLFTVVLQLIIRFICDYSKYWYISDLITNMVYILFVILGGTSLISSLILIIKRRNIYEKDTDK